MPGLSQWHKVINVEFGRVGDGGSVVGGVPLTRAHRAGAARRCLGQRLGQEYLGARIASVTVGVYPSLEQVSVIAGVAGGGIIGGQRREHGRELCGLSGGNLSRFRRS